LKVWFFQTYVQKISSKLQVFHKKWRRYFWYIIKNSKYFNFAHSKCIAGYQVFGCFIGPVEGIQWYSKTIAFAIKETDFRCPFALEQHLLDVGYCNRVQRSVSEVSSSWSSFSMGYESRIIGQGWESKSDFDNFQWSHEHSIWKWLPYLKLVSTWGMEN
jgi:hypothetical protein